jgi:hypothetical protein
MVKHFKGSIGFTALCLALAAWLGWSLTHSVAGTTGIVWIVIVLGVLEVSLSFDNAVVNAAVLKDMPLLWRKRFLTWGMVIAVVGMRIVFPLAIVAVAARLGPFAALDLAAEKPAEYERIITSAHVGISGFGGTFLAMVGVTYFFDQDKEVHWIGFIEKWLARLAALETIRIGIILLALYGVSLLLRPDEALTLLKAGIFGLLAFLVVEAISTLLEPKGGSQIVVRGGFGGFLYLNMLDSAFSFDGVIGAFALSNNIFIIGLGLGIGAMFVRSMTILLVERGTLSEYRYLEHGAFWAILVLSAIMLLSARFEIPEVVTGLIGAVLIALSLWGSARYNRRHGRAEDDRAQAGIAPDGSLAKRGRRSGPR